MKRKLVIFNLLIFMLGLCSCAFWSKDLSMDEKYLVALDFYNSNLEMYLDAYDNASPEAQKKWKADIDPLFKKGNIILDSWKLFLGTSEAEKREILWNEVRAQLMSAMMQYELITIKEGE